MEKDRWSPCKGCLLLHCSWSRIVQLWIITMWSLASNAVCHGWQCASVMGNDRWSPCKGGLLLHCKWSRSVQLWIITMCSLAHIVPLSWDMTFGLHVKAVCCFMIHEVEVCNCEFLSTHCASVMGNDHWSSCKGYLLLHDTWSRIVQLWIV